MSVSLIYFFLILILIPFLVWVAYSTRLGKRSQKSLGPTISGLKTQSSAELFVSVYDNLGNVIIFLDETSFHAYNQDGSILEIPKLQVSMVEYSSYGFCHLVTNETRYKFAYIHFAKDATSAFTAVFDPAYRDDKAVEAFMAALQKNAWPHQEVNQKSLLFLPQTKI